MYKFFLIVILVLFCSQCVYSEKDSFKQILDEFDKHYYALPDPKDDSPIIELVEDDAPKKRAKRHFKWDSKTETLTEVTESSKKRK